MSDAPLLVGVRAAALELGIGRDATYTLIREGRLRAVRVGRKVLVPRTELVSFCEREVEGIEAPE
jgi:excisionase family DNA binding protein